MIGQYIYGFSHPVSPDLLPSSFANQSLEWIPFRDIGAWSAPQEIVDILGASRSVLAEKLVQHQRVLEQLAQRGGILPARLGTFAKDREEVTRILEAGYLTLSSQLERLHNAVEWDLVASWRDFRATLKEIANLPAILEAMNSMGTDLKSVPLVTVEDQMRIGLLVQEALQAHNEKWAERIRQRLQPSCLNLRDHARMNDEMALNVAVLLLPGQQSGFGLLVETLDQEYDRFDFRLVGPLPPYSFATVTIASIDFTQVERARQALGLPEQANREEIKLAHKRSVLAVHPDSAEGSTDPGQFQEVSRAFQVLRDYCREDPCSFRQEDFHQVFRIEVGPPDGC
ncbi:MAG: GvpL/GvpF family gas vesicle protein [bacterium]